MTTATAVNFRRQDCSEAALARAVTYAIQVADGYLMWMSRAPGLLTSDATRPLAGRRVLELGPGATLGTAVLLACKGARVAVADRFLAPWDAEFHSAFFEALLVEARGRGLDTTPIRAILAASAFEASLECCPVGAEQLDQIPGTFDVILSNAVLEHIEDLRETVNNLARSTPAGGYGFHQVDMRDHRSMDRPLEYLTIDRVAFGDLRRQLLCECGAQWRVSDYAGAFTRAGFNVTTSPNMSVDADYLDAVRPRLASDFTDLSDADLTTISALFVLQRAA